MTESGTICVVRLGDLTVVLDTLRLALKQPGGSKAVAKLRHQSHGFEIDINGVGAVVPVMSGKLDREVSLVHAPLFRLIEGFAKLGDPGQLIAMVQTEGQLEFRGGALASRLVTT